MIINIKIVGSDNREAAASLHRWLTNDQYISANAQVSISRSGPDAMGVSVEVIQLILDSGFSLANLALALVKWRGGSDGPQVTVVTEVAGVEKELSPDDMTDQGTVQRGVSGTPAPWRSQCVLIGVSDYEHLRPQLPAVRNNLLRLKAALTDPGIWGIPPERLHTIDRPESAEALLGVVESAAAAAPDALLVYFAGHGLHDPERGLLLALPGASVDGREGTVPWDDLAEVIERANSARCIVWLDCCHAGLALRGERSPSDRPDAANTYILAAAPRTAEAKAPDGEECTAFTGELVRVLRNGITPDTRTREYMSLDAIHHKVYRALRWKFRPGPQSSDPGNIGRLPYFRNRALTVSPTSARPGTGRARPRPLPGFARRDRTFIGVAAIAAAAVIALLVVLITRPWPQGDNILVGPLDLAKYCAMEGTQTTHYNTGGLSYNGGYCVQLVNYTEACNWQYHTTDLHAVKGIDADSALCYTPTDKSVGGISHMADYCTSTLPKAPGIQAKSDNPDYKNNWVCEVKVNNNSVCDEQHGVPDEQARENSNGDIYCYV